MISNDAVVFGILMVVLGFVFYTSNLKSSFWKKFYTFFPVILLCYFIPSLLNMPPFFSAIPMILAPVANNDLAEFNPTLPNPCIIIF